MKSKKIDYKWVVVASSILMVFTVLGFCSSSKSLYITAVTQSLNISRSLYSISDSFRFVTTAVVNMFFGVLVEKLGIRKLIASGFICLIISQLLFSFGSAVWVFYIGGIFLGLGLSWTTTTMVGSIVNKWCNKNKGTIMGIVLASNGVGAALAMQIISPIIYNTKDEFGFRTAYRVVAIILVVVGCIVVALIKDKPKESQEKATAKKEKSDDWEGVSYSSAIKKKYFYLAILSVFLTGMVLQGISGISTPLMQDAGLEESYVATVLSVHSLVLTVSKFSVGFLYDHIGLRKTTNICFVIAALSMVALLNITDSGLGKVFAMTYGAISSFALPLETIMLPIYAMDLFGNKSYNKILGIFVSANTAGYAVGAPVFNVCYDVMGNYNIAIYLAIALVFVIFISMQYVITTAHKIKNA